MMQINIRLTYCLETCHHCHLRTLQMTVIECFNCCFLSSSCSVSTSCGSSTAIVFTHSFLFKSFWKKMHYARCH